MLSTAERERYSRQLILPEFGEVGQQALKSSSVLVIGAGGLGCPILTYLTAVGVGRLGIVDADVIDGSNLHRQVIFSPPDIGKSKAEVASKKLAEQNPLIEIDCHEVRLSAKNAMSIIKAYDIVVDGSDNFPTRYLINDVCVLLNKVLVYGAIHQYEGQVSVFNYLNEDGTRGPNYRDLFPTPPPADQIPNCAEAGVLGVLPGIIGSLQANEVIKIVLGQKILNGHLLLFDARSSKTLHIKLHKNQNNPLAEDKISSFELIDYDLFCGVGNEILPELNAQTYTNLLYNDDNVVVVDVREKHEIGSQPFAHLNIPLSNFQKRMKEIPQANPIVFVCRSGRRSLQALASWLEFYPSDQAWSLTGGVEGMKADDSVSKR